MQTHGGTAAENAVLSPEREFIVRLKVDWNMNGLYDHVLSDLSGRVKSTTTDRSLRGDLPEDILSIQGASAASLDVVLHGSYLNVPLYSIFSPYQPDSPFWGKDLVGPEITYELGLVTATGTVWYPQFVGFVRTVEPDRGTGYVTITALDRVELLRRPVMFPGFAMYEPQRNINGRILGQQIDSQWVIDHCLRPSNVSPTPYRPSTREENGLSENDRTGPQLWISGVGGYLPSIGWLDNYPAQEFPQTETTNLPMYEQSGTRHPAVGTTGPRPKSMTAVTTSPNDVNQYWGRTRTSVNPFGIQVMGFTLVQRGTGGTYWQTVPEVDVLTIHPGYSLTIRVKVGDSGKVWTTWTGSDGTTVFTSPKVSIPVSTESARIIVSWDAFHPSGPKVHVQAGSASSGADWTLLAGTPVYNSTSYDVFQGLVTIQRDLGLNDVFWTATNFGSLTVAGAQAWAGKTATYGAVLDPGLNRLTYLPGRRAEDAWEVISDVVGAEFGAAHWDEAGIFRFWNRDTLRSKSTQIVRNITLDHLTSLKITNTLDGVRNIWSMDSGRKVARLQHVITAESPDQFYVGAGERRDYVISNENVVAVDPGFPQRNSTLPGSPFPAWSPDNYQAYVVQWFEGGVWVENDAKVSGVDIVPYHNENGDMIVAMYNGYGEPARLATNAGQPALVIAGTQIIDLGPSLNTVKDITSINKYKGRNIKLSGDWYQEFSNQNNLLNTMLARTSRPVPTTDQITLAGDPRIQLADAVRIRDPEGFGDAFDVQIYGVRRVFDVDTGLTDTYAIELSRTPGGVWDDPILGIWDSNEFIWG